MFSATDTPLAILDYTTVSSSVNVQDPLTVSDVQVQLDISHTYDQDLGAFLIGPDGTRVQLFGGVGGAGDGFRGTVLSDAAATPVAGGAAPFAGSFRPAEGFAGFVGKDAAGVWTLEITDSVGGDEGTLNGWSLTLNSPLQGETITWKNAAGGDWDTAGNWDLNRLPIGTDDVIISLSGITVTHSTGASDSVNRLTSSAALTLSAGTLSIASASSINNVFTLAGGTLTGAGTLTVTGSLSWTGGEMRGFGTTVVAAGASGEIGGDAAKGLGRRLDNAGTICYTGSGLTLGGQGLGAGVLTNLAGATFAASGDGDFGAELTTIDFEGIAADGFRTFEPTPPGVTLSGVNFSIDHTGTSNGQLFLNGRGAYYAGNSVLSSWSSADGQNNLVITLPGDGYTAVGMDLGSYGGTPVTFTLSTGETYTATPPDRYGGLVRVAFTSAVPITRVRLDLDQPNGDELNIDNISFGTAAFAAAFVNQGSFVRAGAGDTRFDIRFDNSGTVDVQQGTLEIPPSGNVQFDGLNRLAVSPGATLRLASPLGGNTSNAEMFAPVGTVELNRPGTASSPQPFEVMGQDLGGTAAGFGSNFGYGTLVLTNGAYVRLVDDADNAPGSGPEALYVDTLLVPDGCTLDLNSLHVYAHASTVSGTLIGGTITQLPDNRPIERNVPRVGLLTAGGADDWTFYGRAGQAVALSVGTGSGSTPAPLQPSVGYAKLTLLGPGGAAVAIGSNAQSGSPAVLSGFELPADGTYHVRVEAPADHASSTGFYVLTVADATVHQAPLVVSRTATGQLATPYSVDRWNFSAAANQLVQLQLLGASNSSIVFDLVGPDGYTAFSGLAADSGLIALPADGVYTLVAHTTGLAGAYAFQLVAVLATEVEPNDTPAAANVLVPNQAVNGALTPGGDVDFYQVTLAETGRLTIRVGPGEGSTLDPRLTLFGPDGRLLVESDDAAPGDRAALIDQHVRPGTYTLAVAAESPAGAAGSGAYTLTTAFAPAEAPFTPLAAIRPVAGDFNGDGFQDLATAADGGGTLLLGNGDGTFTDAGSLAEGILGGLLVLADFNGDGLTDHLAAAADGGVTVLLSNGDGTFADAGRLAAGVLSGSLVAGDFNGDGRADVVDAASGAVLLSNGDGTFADAGRLEGGFYGPYGLQVGDFNGDGRTDLVATGYGVTVLLSNGDGTFADAGGLEGGYYSPYAFQVGDFNGDGRTDLVGFESGTVLLSNGDGTFDAGRPALNFDFYPPLFVGDFNGDGRTDLVAKLRDLELFPALGFAVLLSNGDGTFADAGRLGEGGSISGLAVGDFNGDGRADLAATDVSGVTVLLSNGDGTFTDPGGPAKGNSFRSLAVGDFNGDGRADLAGGTSALGVNVLLGDGEGTFALAGRFGGTFFDSLVVGDFNGDGRTDLAATDQFEGPLTIFLGNGDGTFLDPGLFREGGGFSSLVVGDFNGDGRTDFATAGYHGEGPLTVFLSNGDGTFADAWRFGEGGSIFPWVVGDFNGDGRADLAATGYDGVAVLLGNGDGSFADAGRYAAGGLSGSLVAGDFNGDGLRDLAVASNDFSNGNGSITVLLGSGDGSFADAGRSAVGGSISRLAAGDFNGDGRTDLTAVINYLAGFTLLLSNGDGTFADAGRSAEGISLWPLAVGDFNLDARTDLAAGALILLGQGDGSLVTATPENRADLRSSPLAADFDGDGTLDAILLDGDGTLRYYHGSRESPGRFEPSEPLDADRPESDATVFKTGAGMAVAAAAGDSVTVYTVGQADDDHTVVTHAFAFATGLVPGRIVAADLNNDGLDDLVTANTFDNTVTIAFQAPDGSFPTTITRAVGVAPSEIVAQDLEADGLLDLAVTGKGSGDVTVLYNDPAHTFTTQHRYRAGAGLYGLDPSTGAVTSLQKPSDVAAGDFDGDAVTDLVVLDSGTHRLVYLRGTGSGGFVNPQDTPPLFTSARPGDLVARDFNGDGALDLAVLMRDVAQVRVYLGHGDGTFGRLDDSGALPKFVPDFAVSAGAAPAGLTVASVNGDGIPDLLVGSEFGDLLVLLGRDDGTGKGTGDFTPDRSRRPGPAGNAVPLAVQDTNGDSLADIAATGNQAVDTVTLQQRGSDQGNFVTLGALAEGSAADPLVPGAVKLTDLDGDGNADLLVTSSGGNDVLLYRGTGPGTFDPVFLSIPVGTSPAGLTVADLSGDGVPDLAVANQGSANVSVIRGTIVNGQWVPAPAPGPRLASGGIPVSVEARDVTGPAGTPDGLPDLLVTNQNNTLTVLAGSGQGFFNDQNAQPVPISGPPVFTPGGQGFAPGPGGIFGFDPTDPASTASVFTAPAGTAFTSLALGPTLAGGALTLVAGLSDGSFELLTSSDGGATFTLADSLDADLTNVSALAALGDEDGSFLEAYATVAGSDTVFTLFFDYVLPNIPTQPPPDDTTPTPDPDNPLVVVPVLLPGNDSLDRLSQEQPGKGALPPGDERLGLLKRDQQAPLLGAEEESLTPGGEEQLQLLFNVVTTLTLVGGGDGGEGEQEGPVEGGYKEGRPGGSIFGLDQAFRELGWEMPELDEQDAAPRERTEDGEGMVPDELLDARLPPGSGEGLWALPATAKNEVATEADEPGAERAAALPRDAAAPTEQPGSLPPVALARGYQPPAARQAEAPPASDQQGVTAGEPTPGTLPEPDVGPRPLVIGSGSRYGRAALVLAVIGAALRRPRKAGAGRGSPVKRHVEITCPHGDRQTGAGRSNHPLAF